MSLTLTYKNDIGTVTMSGGGRGDVRICSLEGLGPVSNEYIVAVYSGHNGQSTISSRALARSITVALEIISENISSIMPKILRVLSRSGTLYINDYNVDRKIECSQVQVPDVTRVLKGKISTFAVQFVCDNPYFEDGENTVVPLYKRTKLLSNPFTMPCMFGEIVTGAEIEILGIDDVEPVITMYYPDALGGVENITIANETTGKSICLNYAPQVDDTVVIDVKKRNITSSKAGNLINYLSNDTFLGDFVLKGGINIISVDLGDVTSGFTVECRYSNRYMEAVIV
ncbi:MAG: phage tail family protein [Clostridia bacterium]|nr:phage tail family protein [Clostridia bacterium]